MKKNILYGLATLLVFISCEDFNDKHFKELDDMTSPSNVLNKEYTLTAADYEIIGKYDSAKLGFRPSPDFKNLKTRQYFIPGDSVRSVLPLLAAAKWPTASGGSTIRMTFRQGTDAPAYLSELEGAATYTLKAEDYAAAWGKEEYAFFTPIKSAEKYLPGILGSAVKNPEAGDVTIAEYFYSSTEPGRGNEESTPKSLDEDFESLLVNQDASLEGWTNFAEKGSQTWQGKLYKENKYIQCSANYAAATEEENTAWFISPAIDLSVAENPVLTFDLIVGYYSGDCLHVLISEDYAGDPASCRWTDVTSNFYLPREPEKGYGPVFKVAGVMDMSAYQGNVNVAFKYVGSKAKGKATTYQIDNVYIGENVGVTERALLYENFSTTPANEEVVLEGWTNYKEKGEKCSWQGKVFNGVSYAQFSAFRSEEDENVGWLVTPKIAVDAQVSTLFSFELIVGRHNANCLQLFVSTNFDGDVAAAEWEEVTSYFEIPEEPKDGYGKEWKMAGILDLSKYASPVVVAFKYTGSGNRAQTTTYQITNVKATAYSRGAYQGKATIRSRSAGVKEMRRSLYVYDGQAWKERPASFVVNPADYQAMGEPGNYNYFSSSIKAENYLPSFLALKLPYAQEGTIAAVVYDYNDGTTTTWKADEFLFTKGVWVLHTVAIETVTEQYAYNGEWKFSPNVEIILIPRGERLGYFQKLADWVWENKDVKELAVGKKGEGYVSSYGNNEYYYGSSEYQNHFDFRPSAWKTQMKDAYEKMSDEELTGLMWERLPEAVRKILELNFPEAEAGDVPVTYQVTFGILDDTGTDMWTIAFKLIGKGEFEWVEDSLKKAE